MAEVNIQLKGWQVGAAAVLLIVVLIFRVFSSMEERTSDQDLVRKVKSQLQTEFFPNDVDKMQSAYDSGNEEELSKLVKSTTTTTINIDSLKASFPILDFSTGKKDVVVKVLYTIKDADGIRDQGEKYYKFEYRPMVKTWGHGYEVRALSYYLNLF